MDEIGQISDHIQAKAGYDADLIWGNGKDESLDDEICVTIIATGFSSSSIPEVLANKKVEKSYHTLVDAPASSNQTSVKTPKPPVPPVPPIQKTKQESFRFNTEGPASDFDSLYSNVKQNNALPYDESSEKFEFDTDFFTIDENDIDKIENVPAYKRRKIKMKQRNPMEEKKVSRYSLSSDENNDIFLSENNSYLHDNVD
jgi:cell division protein FtsZ